MKCNLTSVICLQKCNNILKYIINRKLWERFVEICSKNHSLFGYTWKELQSNLQAIELNTIYGLNPMAKEFVPRGKGILVLDAQAHPCSLTDIDL